MEYYSSLSASQLDSERPTLFELISSNQLERLLSPSLRYILVLYVNKYPKYLIKINNNFDELNLVFRTFIEWYFFKYWSGSFTENFYGIKRVSQNKIDKYNSGKLTSLVPSMIEERRKLSKLQIVVSIFEITGVAYINEKLNYWYEIWYTKYITNQLNKNPNFTTKQNIEIEIKRKFVELYPYIHSSFKLANFIATIMYLSGTTKSPSILTYLFKTNYSRLNQYDYDKNEPKITATSKINKTAPPTNNELLFKLLTKITSPTWKIIKFILGTFFPVAIFSLKFVEWWNSSNFSSKLSKNTGNVLDFTLPPPSTLTSALRKTKSKRKSGKECVLCHKEISNPAIIETGYVFDYACIYNYLENSHIRENEKIDIEKGGRCPITGRKLLGCKWNELKQGWEIEGIRRLIF
ncbi:unnamed protein product [Candida verbasci]|uniref:Peroxisome assembly protein 12 n=1 Tax=Candida verbasci TaxID=1227364 RepID=A0A9W4TSR8_9ASCO|nr:unnamed protein product [Candida verbasci]